MTAAAIFGNRKITISQQRFDDRREIWHGDAYWQVDSYLPYRQLKTRPFKNPAWCTGDV